MSVGCFARLLLPSSVSPAVTLVDMNAGAKHVMAADQDVRRTLDKICL